MQAELRDAINSLGGRRDGDFINRYCFWSVANVNRAVEGYLYLRKSGRVVASKYLVRPAIETVFRLRAIVQKPELMFRIAFSEFNDEKKWVRAIVGENEASKLESIEDQWAHVRESYSKKYPDHPLAEEKLSLQGAAEAAGLKKYYDSHYRLYCKFTHGAFRAITGDLDELEHHDNRTMNLCALVAINVLIPIGATAPNFDTLQKRYSDLPD